MLSRKRANKGTKRMKSYSLLLSSLVISYATLQGKPLLKSNAQRSRAKLEPRPFCALKNFFLVYVYLTREATLCPNILNAIRIFARIAKFLCVPESKQTQNKVERFFHNLAESVFEYFLDSCRILASFAKFFHKLLFAT